MCSLVKSLVPISLVFISLRKVTLSLVCNKRVLRTNLLKNNVLRRSSVLKIPWAPGDSLSIGARLAKLSYSLIRSCGNNRTGASCNVASVSPSCAARCAYISPLSWYKLLS